MNIADDGPPLSKEINNTILLLLKLTNCLFRSTPSQRRGAARVSAPGDCGAGTEDTPDGTHSSPYHRSQRPPCPTGNSLDAYGA